MPIPDNKPDYSDQPPLLSWGGLYSSKNGKAIVGNINLGGVRRGDTRPFGEILIERISQYMNEGKSLRILVFESRPPLNEEARKPAPYSMHSTEGLSREQWQAQSGSSPSSGGPWEQRTQEEPDQPPTCPEPVPQPTMRRGAPRR